MTNMLLLIVVTWYCITHSETLRTTYTRQPMFGQRCHLDNPENLTILLNIARPQCVWNCLSSDSCLVVSQNHHLNLCELSPQFCDKVVPHENFTINVYGLERSQCVNWALPAQYDSKTTVEFLRQPGLTIVLTVGRAKDSMGIYPGKYQNNIRKVVYAANASEFVKGSNCEVLLADPSCLWAWITFTAGNEVPIGAIEAGYYRNDVLYVARGTFHGIQYGIGYYRPNPQLGYFAHYGEVYNKTDLEILVIM